MTPVSPWRPLGGFALFCAAYLLINQQVLVESVLYRLAAHDLRSAVIAFALAGLQAVILLLLVILPGRRLFAVLVVLVAISAIINTIFAQILDQALTSAKAAWLLSEARHAGDAAGEFATAALLGAARAGLAILLLVVSRALLRPFAASALRLERWPRRLPTSAVLVLAILPSAAYPALQSDPQMAERNIYSYALMLAVTPPPPPRAQADLAPDREEQVAKIVWVVDESVNRAVYARQVARSLERYRPVDFGDAASIANCSGPANFALRSGVDVARIDDTTDLRTSPSIWRYAAKAGYRTSLWDGQVTGAPQNYLFDPELALIDDYRSLANGIDTDRALAVLANRELRAPGKRFMMLVLRGVHFQYSDHYPAGTLPADAPVLEQYDAAVGYSKRGFFDALLAGVDREATAVIYTSDHGQIVRDDEMPHCSISPGYEEFAVPLVAVLPDRWASQYRQPAATGRSASQIFPSTLEWMGYDRSAVVGRYDETLAKPSKKRIWFGRTVFPVSAGQQIELHRIDRPARGRDD